MESFNFYLNFYLWILTPVQSKESLQLLQKFSLYLWPLQYPINIVPCLARGSSAFVRNWITSWYILQIFSRQHHADKKLVSPLIFIHALSYFPFILVLFFMLMHFIFFSLPFSFQYNQAQLMCSCEFLWLLISYFIFVF